MEVYIYYFLVFVAGTCFGSFLNVVADRLISGESIIFGRSHCDKCEKTLSPKNLMPVFSFILQKGKCESCGALLSRFYPASEILTGLLFVFSFYWLHVFQGALTVLSAVAIGYLLLMMCLYVIVFLTDMKYQLIPDIIVIIGIVASILYSAFSSLYSLYLERQMLLADSFGKYLVKVGYINLQLGEAGKYFGSLVLSSLGIALFFYILVVLTKERGMGKGDIGLGLMVGLVNGFPKNILAVFLGFVIGAVVSLVLIVLRRKTMKDTVPFGPFLLAGSLVTLVWGAQILANYFHLS
jgi:leader peptidase (prepilin peptidase)/N-methyltransferase